MPQDILQNDYPTLGTIGVESHKDQTDPIRLKWMAQAVASVKKVQAGAG